MSLRGGEADEAIQLWNTDSQIQGDRTVRWLLPRHHDALDGIADVVRAKARTQPGGIVGELVARGEAELAVQQVSELLPVEGIELVGPFPPELQLIAVFTGGVSSHARHADAAQALLRFFAAPEALEVIKAKGMDPP